MTARTTVTNLWPQIVAEVKPFLWRRAFDAWFRPIRRCTIEGESLHIFTPSRLVSQRLRICYYELLMHAATTCKLPVRQIKFTVEPPSA